MRTIAEIKHTNQDGDWFVIINYDSICVNKDHEIRIYDFDITDKYEHEGDYLFLYAEDESFYQVKFEEGNFLVIDLFDKDGEFIESIGSHVFEEPNSGYDKEQENN